MSSLSILNTNSLSEVWFADVASHSVWLIFHFLESVLWCTSFRFWWSFTCIFFLLSLLFCFCFCFFNFIYLFIYGCVGSSFLCEGFLQLWQVGATPHRGARASHHGDPSHCGAQAPDAQAQQLWLTGPVAPQHVGSSQTRTRTHVPCIGRQILNHCTTREAPPVTFVFDVMSKTLLPNPRSWETYVFI